MAAKLKLPITKKESPSKQIDESIFSLYQVQLDRVLISILLQPLRKETTPSVILKITTISLNSFFSQNRDRSSQVDISKTGVIVNLRQGNLTSMCDGRPFTKSFLRKSSMHLQVPLAIFSRQGRVKL